TVPATYHTMYLGEHDRIVGPGVELALETAPRVAERVARRSVYLRHAAHRVRILDPRVADAVRRDVRASGHERAKVGRHDLLAGMRARRVQLRIPRAVCCAERLGGHRTDDIRGRRQDLGVVKCEAADRGHDLCPVDQGNAFLRTELDGLEPRRLERIGARRALALIDRLALAYEDECRVRERS